MRCKGGWVRGVSGKLPLLVLPRRGGVSVSGGWVIRAALPDTIINRAAAASNQQQPEHAQPAKASSQPTFIPSSFDSFSSSNLQQPHPTCLERSEGSSSLSVRRPPLIASFGLLPSGNSFTPDLQTRADAEQVMVLVERRVCECNQCMQLAPLTPA